MLQNMARQHSTATKYFRCDASHCNARL